MTHSANTWLEFCVCVGKYGWSRELWEARLEDRVELCCRGLTDQAIDFEFYTVGRGNVKGASTGCEMFRRKSPSRSVSCAKRSAPLLRMKKTWSLRPKCSFSAHCCRMTLLCGPLGQEHPQAGKCSREAGFFSETALTQNLDLKEEEVMVVLGRQWFHSPLAKVPQPICFW